MGTVKFIAYPFCAAIIGMIAAVLIGMAVFGVNEWQEWQNHVVSVYGALAGMVGAVTGLYWAIRSEEQACQ